MTTRVNISPTVLSWAIQDTSLEVLEHKFPKFREWQSGVSEPTFNQVEELANLTHVPFGYFFLPSPPEEKLPIPYYRTFDNNAVPKVSRELLDTLGTLTLRQEWLRDYLIEEGQDKLSVVGSVTDELSVEEAARKVALTLSLNYNWAAKFKTWTEAMSHLRDRIEEIGVTVVTNGIVGNNTHRKLDPKEFRGFVLVDDYAPMIFINGADSKAAQMFSLAHELMHVFIGRSAVFDLADLQPATNKLEIRCNQIAAEFLVPEKLIREFWVPNQNFAITIEGLARQFKVSQLVIARRALDLKLLSKANFLEFYKNYQILAIAKSNNQSGGNFYANQNQRVGVRFARAIRRAVHQGNLLYRDAYRLTGLSGTSFSKFIEALP